MASMASLGVTVAMPTISSTLCCNSASAVKLSSSANMLGMRLDSATAAAAPSFPRSARSLVVRAGDQPNVWDNVKSAFGDAQDKASEATAKGDKELKKTASQSKSGSEDLGSKAENLKDDIQAQAEDAAEGVKTGIADLKDKVEDAIDSAKPK